MLQASQKRKKTLENRRTFFKKKLKEDLSSQKILFLFIFIHFLSLLRF